jgi:hypothetical protein
MRSIGNGRVNHEPEPMPIMTAEHESSAAEPQESSRLDELSRILARASQSAPDDHQLDDGQLKEMVAAITQEPRAAINQIEEEIGSLREMMAARERMLIEAIADHSRLSKEAVHGLGVVRKALGQIRDAFKAATQL